ncbi:DUF305 domain-containing protein [Sphaerisporangium album]|uniref:DUF305 domain-containing protein n=1 Tax=Sphaerisporangium album TaxID=509200 RepID=A0A367FCT6_9ACTN|nr:DUF305 domain-containing protein [Sphaerisporangium album]RCG28193.1 DUF305 domain-containing protein [Sphaerisporangium album]
MATTRTRSVLVALISCLATAAVMLLVNGRSGPPGDASAEAGFSRDMGVHHAQAAEMGFAVRDASTDPAIRGLAYDIITTQTAQRGVFMGWLQQWGLNQAATRPAMAWMAGHGHGAPATATGPATAPGKMPGMATDAEMKRLQAAKGKDAEILFLQLMIRHHEGGVQMARAVLNRTNRPEVRTMAQHIVDTQDSEIAYMTDLLRSRGAKPYPSILN